MRRATSCRGSAGSIFERYGVPLFVSETASSARSPAAALGSTPLSRPPARCGRRAFRSSATRGGRCSPSSPGPIARAGGRRRPTSCRWACGTSTRLRRAWRGFERPSSTPIAISLPAGATRRSPRNRGTSLCRTRLEIGAQWIARCFAASSSPGFEGSTGYNRHGQWFDQVARRAMTERSSEDYRDLAALGIRGVREIVRWPLVDRGGRYDFSSRRPLRDAARRKQGIEVIWDLFHYGYPQRRRPLERPFSGAVRRLLLRGGPLHRTREADAHALFHAR